MLLLDRKKRVLVCKKCGYEKPVEKESQGQRYIENFSKPKETLIIKEEAGTDNTLPATKAECRKCGNGQAYYWMMQTRSADEPSTRFYRCTKCGFTWREYE
jgi:DNA-directed RNA polymerase subunit M